MEIMFHIAFTVITIAVFAYFGWNLKLIWNRFELGKGKEEVRTDNPLRRTQETLFFGLVQSKMFRDPVAGIMHALIFWGFVVVSIGTGETILSGIIPGFDFRWFLGEGAFYKGFLLSQASISIFWKHWLWQAI